jgi:hypothetical protein
MTWIVIVTQMSLTGPIELATGGYRHSTEDACLMQADQVRAIVAMTGLVATVRCEARAEPGPRP